MQRVVDRRSSVRHVTGQWASLPRCVSYQVISRSLTLWRRQLAANFATCVWVDLLIFAQVIYSVSKDFRRVRGNIRYRTLQWCLELRAWNMTMVQPSASVRKWRTNHRMEHYTNTSYDQMFQRIHRRHRGGPQGARAAKFQFAYGRQNTKAGADRCCWIHFWWQIWICMWKYFCHRNWWNGTACWKWLHLYRKMTTAISNTSHAWNAWHWINYQFAWK